MISSKVAVRYSKALFDLAEEQNLRDKVSADMKLISDTCHASHDLTSVLQSPIIKPDQKEKALATIFNPHITKLTADFIALLARKGRSSYIVNVAGAYYDRYLEMKGISKAQITTAMPMDADTRAEVVNSITRSIGREIELTEKVNTDLIGGFIIRVGDNQDDTSLKTKITKLKRKFSENPYIKDY